MEYRIIVQYAELALKGRNRNQFVKRLRQNIRAKLKSLGFDWAVRSIHDRIFVELGEVSQVVAAQATAELARIPGISWLSHVHWFPEKSHGFLKPEPDCSPIHDLVVQLARDSYKDGHRFAVRVRRSDKNFVITSQQLERDLGASILRQTDWDSVSLKHADQYFYVDISSRGIAVHTNKIKATGGLPVSSTGRVLTLLSGGFDSPVAAWLMANRGCIIDFVHFSASHHSIKDVESYKICRIAKTISEVAGRVRLLIVPYTHFDLALMEQDLEYDLILFRRFMARVAERIMLDQGSQALVTGDNLGQVASQTMENMDSMSRAIESPILRPLLTYNKDQIIALSERLGLFEVCKEPYKDCCALISKNPRTKSKAGFLEKLETQHLSDYESLIEETLRDATEVVYKYGQLMFIEQPK